MLAVATCLPTTLRVVAIIIIISRFFKDFIIDINIGTCTGLVEVVAALKDVILGIVFGGRVLAEVWVDTVTSAVSVGLPFMGVSSSAIKSSKQILRIG